MKKLSYVFLLFFSINFLFSDFVFAKKSKKRSSASKRRSAGLAKNVSKKSSSKNKSAKGKARRSAGSSNDRQQSSSSGSSESNRKVLKEDTKSSAPAGGAGVTSSVASSGKNYQFSKIHEVSKDVDNKKDLECLAKKINFLMAKDCKFLGDGEVLSQLKDNFYCVYSYKQSGKINSVADYYFYQTYGVHESSVREEEAIATINNPPKGGAAYYKYLLDNLKTNTLQEAKILDFLTEEILENIPPSAEEESAISAKNVEKTTIPMNETAADIKHCSNSAKAIVKDCGVGSDQDIKKVIAKSCEEYQGLLVKYVSKLKADVLDKQSELLDVLKSRLHQQIKSKAVSDAMKNKDFSEDLPYWMKKAKNKEKKGDSFEEMQKELDAMNKDLEKQREDQKKQEADQKKEKEDAQKNSKKSTGNKK